MPTLAERIATLAFSTFDHLLEKCKPRTLPNGRREWTPMSAVVLVERSLGTEGDVLTCVSLATGTKCLPHTSLPYCNGTVLHDSHAETLALRGLNRFLLSEIHHTLLNLDYNSPFIDRGLQISSSSNSQLGPFRIKPNVSIHLFITSSPCGDASMDLLIASRPDDNIPWTQATTASSSSIDARESSSTQESLLHGHEHFSQLGRVRLKPSRADAPPTHSKSCSDKLALKQYTGVLNFPVDLLLETVWLEGIVVPESAYHESGWRRAFGADGRLRAVAGGNDTKVEGRFFRVDVLSSKFPEFGYTKPVPDAGKVGNVAALVVRGGGPLDERVDVSEALINGVRQGFRQFSCSRLKESVACRRQFWELARMVVAAVTNSEYGREEDKETMVKEVQEAISMESYGGAKACELRCHGRKIKRDVTERLGGWIANVGDQGWGLG